MDQGYASALPGSAAAMGNPGMPNFIKTNGLILNNNTMERVNITTNTVGLVFKNGELKRVLSKGSHWLFWGERVQRFDMTKAFAPEQDLRTLLAHEALASLLEVVDVADNELVLVYQDLRFATVLTAGKYAFWKGVGGYRFICADTTQLEIAEDIDRNLLNRQPLYPYVRAYTVESFEKGLLFIDGKFDRLLESGNYVYWKNNTSTTVVKADMRQLGMEILGQEILTKDKAQLRINFTVTYQVVDLVKAVVHNKEFEKQLYVLVQLALRAFISNKGFDELMEGKQDIADAVKSTCASKAETLGIRLIDCGVKDIILPGDIKEIMNHVLVAEKRAQANGITRREETAAMRSLLNTAKLMEDNAMLWKMKEMEHVEKIAEKIGEITLSGGGNIVGQLKELFSK
ncbi:slipin family protein [Parapedobacter koreensis]|nr:slipin family protein [Parapedobacter koreensis]